MAAHIVNHSDDFMIYCRGMAEEAMFAMGQIMDRLRLTVNEQKARM